MEDGWTRFATGDIGSIIWLHIWNSGSESWLSQANRIFSRLGITSNFEDYVVTEDILFYVTISPIVEDPPMGYLFLCPPDHFQTASSSFRWPECPAYWSLDPSGVEHLSMEDATRLGFPSISLSTNVRGWSWDDSVYAGLRQFQQAKGFDPDSQDVARHLRHPLWQLASDMDPLFAHVDDKDDEDYHSDQEDQDPLGMNDSDDTRGLASKNDGEPADTDYWAVPLPSVDDEDSCAEEVRDPLDIDEVGSSQNSAESHHLREGIRYMLHSTRYLLRYAAINPRTRPPPSSPRFALALASSRVALRIRHASSENVLLPASETASLALALGLHATALVFGLARVFAHLTAESWESARAHSWRLQYGQTRRKD
ncbi:hypothetical protein B0H13DRAFT_2538887 [Mycena leptocephala]|nr:hypothetical protein B0H13DRAFT_2538887 [Mycena leptocephala]